jgi:hypothetical protein
MCRLKGQFVSVVSLTSLLDLARVPIGAPDKRSPAGNDQSSWADTELQEIVGQFEVMILAICKLGQKSDTTSPARGNNSACPSLPLRVLIKPHVYSQEAPQPGMVERLRL